ncbi:RNA polymerase subunit sigma-70 [Macrococcus sp. S115]|uniref:RNA polymerase subunit sigma-70 n=1 Tax=Macrococcus sp. S115 TaxID=3047480 RepID=UPI0024BC906C|nr:RNA polymerase subunit sigma-70 [Macrococcus sp. S115]MDJ1112376.1 RNA polymerase subunit sigma-70 [Macrococcus sp. S115]
MEDINLLDLIGKGIIKEGSHIVNVPIKKPNGTKYNGQTYMIPLDYLYYNNQNGRIGVALSQYESENGTLVPGHKEEYNNIVQKMLYPLDNEKVKKDMEILVRDIHKKGQQEVGYVLIDGRVIDGNRRFTAKRMLQQDLDITETQYFEAVILEDLNVNNHNDQKDIKSLELQIQFGKLGKEDYDPIDRAIDAYKTIKVNNIMTEKEYADFSDIKINEVRKRITVAELIIKFLRFTNSPTNNYSIAKELELDGPLQDLQPQYKKFKGTEEEEVLLNSLFSKIIQIRVDNENFQKEFRNIVKNVIGTGQQDSFIEDMEDTTDTIVDTFAEREEISNKIEIFERIGKDDNLKKALKEVKKVSYEHSETAINIKNKNKPEELINKALKSLESIDISSIKSLDLLQKEVLKEPLVKIINKIKEIESEIN